MRVHIDLGKAEENAGEVGIRARETCYLERCFCVIVIFMVQASALSRDRRYFRELESRLHNLVSEFYSGFDMEVIL